MIRFGTCKKIDGARIRVAIPGFSGDAGIDCLLMQPCAGGPSAWIPPAVGDVVVVAVDEERLEDSVVLGVVYPDAKTPPKTGQSEAALRFSGVYLGDPTPTTKCPRDDRVQAQLSAIKSALDSLVATFNAHVHQLVTMPGTDAAAIAASAVTQVPAVLSGTFTIVTAAPAVNSYVVGRTDSDCVYAG